MSTNEPKTKVDVDSESFEEKHDKQAHGIYVGVIIFLIVVFVVGFTYGIFAVTALEGQVNMSEEDTSLDTAPQTAEDARVVALDSIEFAVEDQPKLTTDHAFSIDESSIETQFGPELSDTFKFVKDGINETIKQDFSFDEVNFFEDMTPVLREPNFKTEDILDYQVNYTTYKCRACDNTSDEPLDHCKLCGCDLPYRFTYNGDYEFIFNLKTEPQIIKDNFAPRSVDHVMDLLKGKYENLMKINSMSFDYDSVSVKVIVNRTTGQVSYLEYTKNINVKTNITFINEFESLGTSDFNFKAIDITAYTYTWPEIMLSTGNMQIGYKDSTNNIQSKLICDDPNNKTVTWTSSDPSICEVDNEGYLKSHKKTGEATITASFEFGGQTFSKDCTVVVREGVTGVNISKRKAALNVGDTLQLDVKIKPSNATVKTVKWYGTDDSVLQVSEDGVVTALSSGTAKVFAVTDDGSYRSTCEVTVK